MLNSLPKERFRDNFDTLSCHERKGLVTISLHACVLLASTVVRGMKMILVTGFVIRG